MKKIIYSAVLILLSGCATAENGYPKYVAGNEHQVSYAYDNLLTPFGGPNEKDAQIKANWHCKQYLKRAEFVGLRNINNIREAIFNCI